MGRKVNIEDGDLLSINGHAAKSRLKLHSLRRAVIDKVVELGGRAMLSEVNAAFGFDTREIVNALVSGGWLTITHPYKGQPPLPTRWPHEQEQP